MPIINLQFPNPINVSVQIGDKVYFTPTTINGVHNTADTIIELGVVQAINGNVLAVFYVGGAPAQQLPIPGEFIMFAKDREVNMSSLLGYYAKFRIKNNSQDQAEMYSISVDVTESSK
tara:strand:- start:325 stop:678 length:354 start_codon:yes stop_codon:yes gene_type:complete